MDVNVRPGKAEDVPAILALIKELAEYEKAPEAVSNTEEQMLTDGFGDKPIFSVFVAENEENKIIGIALYYTAYSTWKGRMIYLDDLVVSKEFRKKGIGQLLINEVFKVAKEENANLIKWQVLDWNDPAIQFYKKYEVTFDDEWINCTIGSGQLSKFAV